MALDAVRERICVLDKDGVILCTNHPWNVAAFETGANRRRCGPGVNYLEICQSAHGKHSEGAAEAAAGIEKVLSGAIPEFTLDYPCPSPARRAWYKMTARPLSDPRGGAVISHSDISSQVLLAERLQRESRLGGILENPVDSATLIDGQGIIQFQSAASEYVLGWPAEELRGRVVFELIHSDDLPLIRALFDDGKRDPARWHRAEYRLRDREGGWRTIDSVARKLGSDPPGGWVLNSRDITERRLAEKAALDEKETAEGRCRELEALIAETYRTHDEQDVWISARLNEGVRPRLAALSLQGPGVAFQEGARGLDEELQTLANALHPAMLDHLGLAVALREYCLNLGERCGIEIRYSHRGIQGRLPARVRAALYRVAVEALDNVDRHAQSKQAWVSLSRTEQGIRLLVRDRGVGLRDGPWQPGSGLGLPAMRERLRAVNGSLKIRSRPGAGAQVVAVVPLSPFDL